jgi:ribosomal protein S18 acetylase RimI-like enzyme
MSEIRKIYKSDIDGLKNVLNTIDLFPSEMLDETEKIWFTWIQQEIPVSIGYCAPEELTDKTYNLYAIGVKNDLQNKGIGKAMMTFIEEYLKREGKRVLIVETSSMPEYENTRAFYLKIGYTQEAVIRDFWKEGDDKVIFWKKLND